MASIMTNASALTALQSLNATNKALEQTQSRISTGYRVSTASDNAAYWSIATTMRSDNKANSVVQDALGLGAGKVDTAYTAMNKAIEVVDAIKQKILLAKASGSEQRSKIQGDIDSLQKQLKDNIAGASYAGTNMLKTDSTVSNASLGIISSYNRDSAGNVTTGMIDIPLKNVRLIDANGTAKAGILDSATGTVSTKALLDMSVSNLTGISGTTDADKFDKLLTDVEKVLGKMASAASELGAAKSRVDMQKDFVSKLSDSIDRGVGQLVDADMDRESTRLQALQVQQQLGIQALSIANSSAQNILSLFKS